MKKPNPTQKIDGEGMKQVCVLACVACVDDKRRLLIKKTTGPNKHELPTVEVTGIALGLNQRVLEVTDKFIESLGFTGNRAPVSTDPLLIIEADKPEGACIRIVECPSGHIPDGYCFTPMVNRTLLPKPQTSALRKLITMIQTQGLTVKTPVLQT